MADDLSALLLKIGVKPVGLEQGPKFVLGENRWITRKRKKEAKRRSTKRFIKPENAQQVADARPGPGEAVHCILNGNFVLADLIPRLMDTRPTTHLRIATLGLSERNAELLAEMHKAQKMTECTIICSHYFQQVNKDSVFAACVAKLQGAARIVVTRSHAKVILIPQPPDFWVIEGSANLRSSDNLEQITIFNDQPVHDFHAAWIDELAGQTEHG